METNNTGQEASTKQQRSVAVDVSRTIIFNKPCGVLTKFTDDQGRPTLADHIKIPNIYPAGRLDQDSEGLLVLTDDGPLQHELAHPNNQKWKGYWAQVEGTLTPSAIDALQSGLLIKGYRTKKACAKQIDQPADLWERDPPIRERKHIPTDWLEIWICEGKNRQVRRMSAAVGFPTLRLIRFAMGPYHLKDLASGAWREVGELKET